MLPVPSTHDFTCFHRALTPSLRVPCSMCAPRHRPASSRVALVALYAARDLMPGDLTNVMHPKEVGERIMPLDLFNAHAQDARWLRAAHLEGHVVVLLD